MELRNPIRINGDNIFNSDGELRTRYKLLAEFVKYCQLHNGTPPSLGYISEKVGITRKTAHLHFKALVRDNVLRINQKRYELVSAKWQVTDNNISSLVEYFNKRT